MFGFQGGETPETVARKKLHMADAKQRWSFLTPFDLSTIINAGQLATMVKIRTSISEQQAQADVAAWMHGKQF